jgi:hypothetical protein
MFIQITLENMFTKKFEIKSLNHFSVLFSLNLFSKKQKYVIQEQIQEHLVDTYIKLTISLY